MMVGETIGYLAAVLVFFTFYMKTIVPLRIIGICSNCAFIAYGYLDVLYPVLILHSILLPLNTWRLRQMLQLSRQVREAASENLNMDWIKPFSSTWRIGADEVLFNKGDPATDMFVIISGRFKLMESGIEIMSPHVVGEFALLTPERKRTQTVKCLEDGTLLQIGYSQVEQLFFQNPKFGYYFLKLITSRLFENTHALAHLLAERDQEILNLRKALAR
jgi:CRP/FNR family transcriptional regulator, cyclic AMP receptor protein